MTLDFKDLQRIYRAERMSASLQDIPKDFYSSGLGFISKLGKEHKEPALKLFEKIYYSRVGKITRLVSREGETSIPKNIVSIEMEMYKEFTAVMSEYTKKILKEKKDKIKTEEKTTEEICDVVNEEKTSEERKTVEEGGIVVRIISPIPAIIGSDRGHYGPFKEGDEVRLPAATARILMDRGVAEGLD